MAEWSGPRRRRRGNPELKQERPLPPDAPVTPGAVVSPQRPGQVPDRSTIAGKFSTSVPPATSLTRPETEYQSAQRILGVFSAEPGDEREPGRYEQATASFEEMRKADPALRPAVRPAPGYIEGVTAPAALPAGTDISASDTGF